MEQTAQVGKVEGVQRNEKGHLMPGSNLNPEGLGGKGNRKKRPVPPPPPYEEPVEETAWPDDLRAMLRVSRTVEAQDQTADHRFWREFLKEDRKAFVSKLLDMKAQARQATAADTTAEDAGTRKAKEALQEALKELEAIK